jgi:gluconolactonase
MTRERSAAEELVRSDGALERLATGFVCTEGPIWHPQEACLLFSDIPADSRYRWSDARGVELAQKPTNKGNGMTLDEDLRLIVCEHLTNAVVRVENDGTRTVLASRYGDAELNSPNDVVAKNDGAVYFTDPNYGRQDDTFGLVRPCELPFQGVFRINPDGQDVTLLVDDFEQPNGLCFSPGEDILYVNDTPRGLIRAFGVGSDGLLSDDRVFYEGIGTRDLAAGAVDGMKCDVAGNVYVTGPGGIWVIAPDSTLLGVLAVPERTLNLTWGGPEWADLYIATFTAIYRLPMRISGAPASYMRDSGSRL